jgi:hypothetical protein
MNRRYHLEQTLIQNIQDNLHYKNIEFVLLDYNSSDGLETWVKNNLDHYIQAGILKYFKTTEPAFFHRSHSRNIALKLAEGDIVCNLDADNFLGKNFAFFINYRFSFNANIFMTSGKPDGSYGRVCVKKEDFLKVRGYDEKMSGWGYEDDDFYKRLLSLDLQRTDFFEDQFTQIIEHEIEDSFNNDDEVSNVKTIYVKQDKVNSSTLLYIMNDDTYRHGNVHRETEDSEIQLERPWELGSVNIENTAMILKFENTTMELTKAGTNLIDASDNSVYREITNTILKNSVLRMLTSLQNKYLYLNKSNASVFSNAENWGKATLVKNFRQKLTI